MPADKGLLIKDFMHGCGYLYRENSRLKGMVFTQPLKAADKEVYEALLSDKDAVVAQKETKINSLKQRVSYLERQLYGKKAERFIKSGAQDRWLDFEDSDMLPQKTEAAEGAEKELKATRGAIIARKKAEKQHPTRKPLPENLKREVVHVHPEGYNPEEWALLPGEEMTEIPMHEPGKSYIRRIVRHTAKRKGTNEFKTGPLPVMPIARSYASTSLLADMMIGKYVNHIPFHKQLEQFKRVGVHLPASTVNDWSEDVTGLLKPLYFWLQELVMQTDYIQSDETTIPVMNDERHKTVRGYIWLVRSTMVGRQFFYYDGGSRSGKVVLRLFGKFRGAIQTGGYERCGMLDAKKGIILLGCWAHVRRHFQEAGKDDVRRADYALAQMQLLCNVERKAGDGRLTYEQRAELRARLVCPIFMHFGKWLVSEYPKVMKGSPIGKAIRYTCGRFDKLPRYHLDGRYRSDSSKVENKVRPVACGEHSYLFCGDNDATEDAAAFYSFLGYCKVVGAGFRTWLIYFLGHTYGHDDNYSIDLAELLFDNLLSKDKVLSVTSPESPKRDS